MESHNGEIKRSEGRRRVEGKMIQTKGNEDNEPEFKVSTSFSRYISANFEALGLTFGMKRGRTSSNDTAHRADMAYMHVIPCVEFKYVGVMSQNQRWT